MKVNAIVYNSNAGHTEGYARLLAQQTGLPVCNLDEAKEKVKKGEKVVFLGWLMAGIVKGYKKANRRFDVVLTVGVGMTPPTESERARLSKQNKIELDKFQMLLGGYDIKLLHGVYKFMMNCMSKVLKSSLGKKQDMTADEKLMYDMAVNGRYCVSADNLAPVIAAVSD